MLVLVLVLVLVFVRVLVPVLMPVHVLVLVLVSVRVFAHSSYCAQTIYELKPVLMELFAPGSGLGGSGGAAAGAGAGAGAGAAGGSGCVLIGKEDFKRNALKNGALIQLLGMRPRSPRVRSCSRPRGLPCVSPYVLTV